MEDIKLWELGGTQAKPLGLNNRLESEGFFEDTLVKNPELANRWHDTCRDDKLPPKADPLICLALIRTAG